MSWSENKVKHQVITFCYMLCNHSNQKREQ